MNDYSDIFTEEEKAKDPKAVAGFYNRKIYKENKNKFGYKTWKE